MIGQLIVFAILYGLVGSLIAVLCEAPTRLLMGYAVLWPILVAGQVREAWKEVWRGWE